MPVKVRSNKILTKSTLKMKTILKITIVSVLMLPMLVFAQEKPKMVADPAVLNKLKTAIEADPNNLKAHEEYIKASGIENKQTLAQYEIWHKKFPKSAIIPYAVGAAYANEESPKAKPYLLEAINIDPRLAKAWSDLWIDAERWGKFELGREYLAKAVAAEPQNPDYAFYFSSSFATLDREKYIQLTEELVKRFPSSERGAQGLYWLAVRSPEKADKVKWFAVLKSTYAPEKFGWSSSGMSSYFDLLLQENPQKAQELAKELEAKKVEGQNWAQLGKIAESFVKIQSLIAEKKPEQAQELIHSIKLPRYFRSNNTLLVLKAKVAEIAYHPNAGYDTLMKALTKTPAVSIKEQLMVYGRKSGKTAAEVEADIWKHIDATAKAATSFTLKRYLTSGFASLADFKGKVVLLTYWFPGCGPCRGEFPHFENVIRKFKGQQVDYVGINIVPEQDEYVIPFMKSSGYSFTPLADVKDRVKGNLDNRGAAPTNFLIDQSGRIIFSNFRTDGDNEEDLEMMINLVLKNGKRA